MRNQYLEHNDIKFYQTPYDDYYISTDGVVLSTKGKAPRILKPGDNGCGYMFVVVYCDSGHKIVTIHRIMAETFDLPGSGDTVDHIDRNKLNNSLSNLRWATASEQLTNRVYPETRSKRLTQEDHRELFEKYCNSGCSQIELTHWANERFNRNSNNNVYSQILNGCNCKNFYQQLPPELKEQAQRLSDSRNPRLRGGAAHD
ncbi:HNH endonuclease [Edwardsiella piscicida]|uniref:HNH endonuclease n=1 Tax=Edwardsiella piscicida TaxID=1263550 RepID=UPI000D515F38|nr:HNH endonuclease [Edwardsiella piscicida]UCQ40064.1 HNH endonuclease [Edwardsiella piscicida]